MNIRKSDRVGRRQFIKASTAATHNFPKQALS